MATLQVRDVPGEVHRTLKARAAGEGKSLSEYTLGELTKIAEQPTIAELSARIRLRGGIDPPTAAADLIREDRDVRGASR